VTIAACYVSAEGVVFGADSTTTMYVSGCGPGSLGCEHQFDFGQKVFQVGENSTLGMTMWGLGSFGTVSYRTLIAQFADSLVGHGARAMDEVAARWSQFFWPAYSTNFGPFIQRAQALRSQAARTPEEEVELACVSRALSGGFCIGGYLMNDRTPRAFQVLYDPTMTGPVAPVPLGVGSWFWGCPNLIDRLVWGLDAGLAGAISRSDKWSGTPQDLYDLMEPHSLGQPFDLPIREAIDWVHAAIYTTIKGMKFSHLAPVCGGPVEIAVITTDRLFRWVRHKSFDAAIGEGGLLDVYRDRR
jgi:hypothetical protein